MPRASKKTASASPAEVASTIVEVSKAFVQEDPETSSREKPTLPDIRGYFHAVSDIKLTAFKRELSNFGFVLEEPEGCWDLTVRIRSDLVMVVGVAADSTVFSVKNPKTGEDMWRDYMPSTKSHLSMLVIFMRMLRDPSPKDPYGSVLPLGEMGILGSGGAGLEVLNFLNRLKEHGLNFSMPDTRIIDAVLEFTDANASGKLKIAKQKVAEAETDLDRLEAADQLERLRSNIKGNSVGLVLSRRLIMIAVEYSEDGHPRVFIRDVELKDFCPDIVKLVLPHDVEESLAWALHVAVSNGSGPLFGSPLGSL